MSETKELTVLDEFKILEIYKYDVIERAAEAIETEVMSEVVDVTTSKGREREKSLAFKVSQAKSRVVKMANASVEVARATVKGVTSERQRLEARFDGIRDKRKEASVKWDVEEQERCGVHKGKIQHIRWMGEQGREEGISNLTNFVEQLLEIDPSTFEEYEAEGELVKAESLRLLNELLLAAKQREADAAELKKLQDEAAERKVEDAEREAKEKAFHMEEVKRVADANRAKKLAEETKKQEATAKKLAEEAEIERGIEIAKGIEQAKEEERERLEAIQKEKDAEAKHIEDQLAHERLVKHNVELERKADKEHRAKVLDEACNAIASKIEGPKGGEVAYRIISAIENGEIPHVTINF